MFCEFNTNFQILRGPKKKVLRFPPNPGQGAFVHDALFTLTAICSFVHGLSEANWGPKRRAGRLIQQAEVAEVGQSGSSDSGRRPLKRTKVDMNSAAKGADVDTAPSSGGDNIEDVIRSTSEDDIVAPAIAGENAAT